MNKKNDKILLFDSLKIGYSSGKAKRVLLPPLKGSARKGELIAVIGKNGIGKSTLLRTITGLQPLLDGQLKIDDKKIQEFSRIQLSSKVGYVSTEIVKVSNMRVYDLVATGRFPHTNWFGEIDEINHAAILDALMKTGMTDFINRPVTELSDGERQRAMIAMVLAQDADILVMDEPTAFLDIPSKFEIIRLMKELTRKRQKTVIFSTHDLTTAISQADKIWLILRDKLIEGAPEDLMLHDSFNTLFDSEFFKFNVSDGTFIIKSEKKANISVSGEGDRKRWTEKALIREGYELTDSDPEIIIEVPSEQNSNWIFRNNNFFREFNSIYDLISSIRNENIIS